MINLLFLWLCLSFTVTNTGLGDSLELEGFFPSLALFSVPCYCPKILALKFVQSL